MLVVVADEVMHSSWVVDFDPAKHADLAVVEIRRRTNSSSVSEDELQHVHSFAVLSKVLGTELLCHRDFRCSPKLSALTYLDVGGNNLGDLGASDLTQMIRGTHSLRTLELYFNQITGAGAEAIVRNLSIPLSEGETTEKGHPYSMMQRAPSIIPLQQAPTALTSLRLGWNDLGDIGAAAIARLLATTCFLTDLNISYNDISASAGELLCGAVRQNTALTACNLCGNGIPLSGLEALNCDLTTSHNDRSRSMSTSTCGEHQ